MGLGLHYMGILAANVPVMSPAEDPAILAMYDTSADGEISDDEVRSFANDPQHLHVRGALQEMTQAVAKELHAGWSESPGEAALRGLADALDESDHFRAFRTAAARAMCERAGLPLLPASVDDVRPVLSRSTPGAEEPHGSIVGTVTSDWHATGCRSYCWWRW